MADHERYGEVAARFYRFLIDPIVWPLRPRIADELARRNVRTVLDIACATGAQARLLARRGLQPVGIDLSSRMIAAASRRAVRIPFVCGSALELPFPTDSFDAALLSLALHEHPEEERHTMVREALRVVRSSGTLLVADFAKPICPGRHIPWQIIRAVERSSGPEHKAGFLDYVERGSLDGLLARLGLVAEATRPSHFGCIRIVTLTKPTPAS